MTETKLLPDAELLEIERGARFAFAACPDQYERSAIAKLMGHISALSQPSPTAAEIMEAAKASVKAWVANIGGDVKMSVGQWAALEFSIADCFTALLSCLRTYEDGVEAAAKVAESRIHIWRAESDRDCALIIAAAIRALSRGAAGGGEK